jgi:chromosomal replication initiator protein
MSRTISEITQIWDRTLAKLQERLPDRHVYSAFFPDTYIHSINNEVITVIANSSLAKTMLNTNYRDLIEQTVGEITQTNYQINFIEKNEIPRVSEIITEQKSSFFKNAKVNPNLTFDNFVVGQNSNLQAYQAAIVVANSPGKLYNPLFLFSSSGLGKTHLLHAIGNHVKQNNPNLKVLYVTTDEFTDEFIRFVRENQGESMKDFFRTVDVLLMDDIQFLANKQMTSETFFHLFNLLVNAGKQIVLTSDRHPSELQGLEDRLVTRFNSGLQINITTPDLETRKNILRKKISLNNLEIEDFDENVITFFAENFPNNVRELEGALNRLLFYVISIAPTKHVTMEVALNSVQSLINVKDAVTKLSETKIINVVADYYNLTPALIIGRNRTGQVALARHIAMYLTREILDLPFVRVGKAFGGKDHSTVINAIVKVEKQLKTDPALLQAINEIKERLQ